MTNARDALQDIADFVMEASSFVDTFEHEDHGDDDAEGTACRFDHASPASFDTLAGVIDAAETVVRAFVAWGIEGYYDADAQFAMQSERTQALDALTAALGK